MADTIAGLSLSEWAIIIGITCTVIICVMNWYYR
ncbi:phage holin family protein (plasmid) [Citrobacter meridianamericanus]